MCVCGRGQLSVVDGKETPMPQHQLLIQAGITANDLLALCYSEKQIKANQHYVLYERPLHAVGEIEGMCLIFVALMRCVVLCVRPPCRVTHMFVHQVHAADAFAAVAGIVLKHT